MSVSLRCKASVEFLSRPRCAIQRVKHLLFFQSCDLMNNQVYFRGYGNKGIAFAVPIVLHFS
jgi:hypothetical protein